MAFWGRARVAGVVDEAERALARRICGDRWGYAGD